MSLRLRSALLTLGVLLAPTVASAQEEFQRPGTTPAAPEPAPVDNGAIAAPSPSLTYEILPLPDRNRIIETLGVKDNPLNPYAQSTLKGDRPVFDDWFVTLEVLSDTLVEPRSFPVPSGAVTTARPGENDKFGKPDQLVVNETLLPSLSITKGDTTFMPPEFEFRFTPAINYNYAHVEELGLLRADPSKGTNRNDTFIGIQEAFLDYHLRNVSDRFDFDSIRVGIQPINLDFRGFLFQDDQLAARLFGNRANNRFQYNLEFIQRVEKDTNSGLNDLSQPLRRDYTAAANLFVQDLPVEGMTTEFSVVHNWNREQAFYYDKNGFLVRPAAIGDERPHKYNVTYFGLNNDGHFGRVNLSSSAYYVIGNDSHNTFSQGKANIRAYFAAAEPSIDFDWIRVRASALYASGDHDPYGKTETGFDAIQENPQIAGADTSYWIRQAIPLIGGGGVNLSSRNGVLPSLRSSGDEGQSNFINPGLTLFGVGTDLDILPELRVSFNANHLWFNDTTVLNVLRQQPGVHDDIGWDLSSAVTYRPFDTQNVVLRLSGAMLVPGQGFKDLYISEPTTRVYYSVLTNIILKY
ncbi:MAG: uncharacterized protein JWO51_5141 [Rhodospirillales bacterium]|nr:uncharacterized protein [Rhodospirillales bacterium]